MTDGQLYWFVKTKKKLYNTFTFVITMTNDKPLSSPPFQGGVGVVAEVMTKIFNRNKSKDTRKELRNNLTKGEIILWQNLKGSKLGGFKLRRQQSVQDFVVDFYCPEIKLAAEVDGQTVKSYVQIFTPTLPQTLLWHLSTCKKVIYI
jgi:hypothetical protein